MLTNFEYDVCQKKYEKRFMMYLNGPRFLIRKHYISYQYKYNSIRAYQLAYF